MLPRAAQDRLRVIRGKPIFNQPSGLMLQGESIPLSDHYGMMLEVALED